MHITQEHILNALIEEAEKNFDAPVLDQIIGAQMVGIKTGNSAGICSLVPAGAHPFFPDRQFRQKSLHDLARGLLRQGTLEASLALAGINASLNREIPGPEIKAQELIMELGRGRNVAVIGHFPFVSKIRNHFKNFWVLEKRPKSFDLPEEQMPGILPRVDLAAITATTLLNGTLAGILNMCSRQCIKIIMGPSTPLASCLFKMGANYLAGAGIIDHEKVFAGIRKNLCFRQLEGVHNFIANAQPAEKER